VRHVPKPSGPRFVADLRPRIVVDDELDWFFNRAEGDMGLTSNYRACLGRLADDDYRRTAEDAAEAAHRHRRIRLWLKAIPDSDAGVLQAAYELREWPIPLFDALGRLTGVYVRMACALDPWPADRASQQVVEMARAEWLVASGAVRPRDPAFAVLRRQAEVRFVRAHQAYALARSILRGRRGS